MSGHVEWYLGINTSYMWSIYPGYDMKDEVELIEQEFRSKNGGGLYHYQFGSFDKIEFSVSYVSSWFKDDVNGWWRTKTKLKFFEVVSGDVISVKDVKITNRSTPIGSPIKPYWDQFKGKILLETY